MIREVVKILVGKGFIEVRRGIGARIRSRANWGMLDDDVLAWHQSAQPNREFLNQSMDFRQVIEPKAARWAAARGTAGHGRIRQRHLIGSPWPDSPHPEGQAAGVLCMDGQFEGVARGQIGPFRECCAIGDRCRLKRTLWLWPGH